MASINPSIIAGVCPPRFTAKRGQFNVAQGATGQGAIKGVFGVGMGDSMIPIIVCDKVKKSVCKALAMSFLLGKSVTLHVLSVDIEPFLSLFLKKKAGPTMCAPEAIALRLP